MSGTEVCIVVQFFSKICYHIYYIADCCFVQNNADTGVPVRVVRGHESTNSYCGKVYTYDGLYQVSNPYSIF